MTHLLLYSTIRRFDHFTVWRLITHCLVKLDHRIVISPLKSQSDGTKYKAKWNKNWIVSHYLSKCIEYDKIFDTICYNTWSFSCLELYIVSCINYFGQSPIQSHLLVVRSHHETNKTMRYCAVFGISCFHQCTQ